MVEIGRLLTAMVTPFDDKGAVDFEQAKKLAHALLDSGSDGIVLSGTTGESPTLTTDEKMRLFGEVNYLEGRVESGHIATPLGRVCAPGLADGTLAEVLVRAEGLRIDGTAETRGRVLTRRMLGRASLLHLSVPGFDGEALHFHARITACPGPAENDEVGLGLDEEQVFVFPIGEGGGDGNSSE